MNKKILSLFILLFSLVILTGCPVIVSTDTTAPSFSGITNETIEVGETFDFLDGVSANDDIDGDLTNSITYNVTDADGNVVTFDTDVAMEYYINFTVMDASDNTSHATRIITVVNPTTNTAPVITASVITIEYGTAFDLLANVVATDFEDGDITDDVTYTVTRLDASEIPEFDGDELGEYIVTFSVTDSDLNTASISTGITVVDTVAPEFQDYDTEVTADNEYFYDPSNITAIDNYDGDISNQVTYVITYIDENTVVSEINLLGEYSIVYNVFDSSGNEATTTVLVTVIDVIPPEVLGIENTTLGVEFGSQFVLTDVITAIDEGDGDVSELLEFVIYFDGTDEVTFIDTTIPGIYIVMISAFDYSGNETNELFTVVVGEDIPLTEDISVEDAQMYLGEFYYDVVNSTLTVEQVCQKYVLDAPFDIGVLYEDCITGLPELRSVINSYTINSVIVNPDNTDSFLAYVTLDVDGEIYDFDVAFDFGTMEFSDNFYLRFISDPFAFIPSVADIPLEEAELKIQEYYTNLLEISMTPQEFCEEYIINSPSNEGTLQDCITGVENIRSMNASVIIVEVFETIINTPDGPTLDGFMADVSVTINSDTYGFDLYFAFFESPYGIQIVLFGSPLGDGGGSGEIIFATVTEAEALAFINTFYTDLLDPSLDATTFCEMYVMDNLEVNTQIEMDLTSCITYVNEVRTQNPFFTINSVVATDMPAGDSTIPAFELDITFTHDGAIDYQYLWYFTFIENGDGSIRFIWWDPQFIIGESSGSTYADLTNPEALLIIEQFYADLMDPLISSATFCDMYLLLQPSMAPMESPDCVAYRENVLTFTYGFSFDHINFIPAMDGAPPYFDIEVTRTDGIDTVVYNTAFVFLLDQYGNPLLAVPFDGALNGYDMNSGGEPQFADIDLITAELLIDQFYIDYMDFLLDNTTFCDSYYLLDEYMVALDEANCSFIRDQFSGTTFSHNIRSIVFIDGTIDNPPYFETTVSLDHGGYSTTFVSNFMFMLDELDLPLLTVVFKGAIGESIYQGDINMMFSDLNPVQNLILQYYNDLLDPTIPTNVFCDLYYGVNPDADMSHCNQRMFYLMYAEANDYVVDLGSLSYYFPEGNYPDGPTVFTINIIETNPSGIVTPITVEFSVTVNGEGMLIPELRIPPLGPQRIIAVHTDLVEANALINMYYSELFNPGLPNELFCMAWVLNNPFYPGDMIDCTIGRDYALSQTAMYTVINVGIEVTEPYMIFYATVEVNDGIGTMYYDLSFAVMSDELNPPFLVIMDEVIMGMPPPPIS